MVFAQASADYHAGSASLFAAPWAGGRFSMNLAAVRRLALALPEATEAPHFHYTSFRVRGKIFATAPPVGDTLHVFIPEPQREQALALHAAFAEKLYWGQRVCGLRLLLPHAQPQVVKTLLRQAWAAKAPRQLLRGLGD
jgi:hypothetical protein